MTIEKYDQYSKQFVADLLESKGDAQTQYEILPGEAHQADVYFVPTPGADFQPLGLLGRIAAKPCLIEPFRNPPSKIGVQTGIQKLFTLRSELLNKVKRDNKSLEEKDKKSLPEDELPHLWILLSSASDNLLNFFDAKVDCPNWCEGVYFFPEGFRTVIVAINRLPPTPETLLLRLLGKGTTQQQAIEEILAFPKDNGLRNHVEYLLYRWHIYLGTQEELTEEEELFMNLSKLVEERQQSILQQGIQQGVQQCVQQGVQQGIQQGIQQGRLEERRIFVENLLKLKFGNIDESLSPVIEPLIKLTPEESSRLIWQASRETLLMKLSH
jgi:hypothetical protein